MFTLKYVLYLIGSGVLGGLLVILTDYTPLDWEFYVLAAPYIILGGITT